jgi:hypothetical protein
LSTAFPERRKEAHMEHLHIYEIVGDTKGGGFNPTKLIHTKAEITKKTAMSYYYMMDSECERVARKDLNGVLLPEGTRAVLTTPDNELARNLFTEYINELIRQREEDIAVYKQARDVVAAFKD